jgi:hypothetical protein
MKNLTIAVCAVLLLVGAVGANAQQRFDGATIGTEQSDIHFLSPDGQIQRGVRCASPPLDPAVRAETEAFIQAFAAAHTPQKLNITIPVAFHVIYQSRRGTTTGNVPQSQIDAQIAVLNAAFQGTGFSFSLDTVTRTNNRRWFTGCYSNNVENQMKSSLAVDVPNTLNIYSCQPKGGILGYAYLPQSLPEGDTRHGVVALYSSLPGGSAAPYNEGDTVTHEVGHYLGLDHTFANGCNAPGDNVSDTPYEASPAYGCPIGRDSCASAGLDPIFNFMDYTDDDCMDEFTSGQGARMDNLVTIYKPSLL